MGKAGFEYLKSRDFMEKVEFFKGCEMNHNLWHETCKQSSSFNYLVLNPTKDYNKLLNNCITYKSQRWKLNVINIKKEYKQDTFFIHIESIETGEKEVISFESDWFRWRFFDYWCLYLWAQFYHEPDFCNHLGDLGIFNTFEDSSRYFKWLEDNYVNT